MEFFSFEFSLFGLSVCESRCGDESAEHWAGNCSDANEGVPNGVGLAFVDGEETGTEYEDSEYCDEGLEGEDWGFPDAAWIVYAEGYSEDGAEQAEPASGDGSDGFGVVEPRGGLCGKDEVEIVHSGVCLLDLGSSH